MNQRQRGRCEFVVARDDTPEVFGGSEVALDQVRVAVDGEKLHWVTRLEQGGITRLRACGPDLC